MKYIFLDIDGVLNSNNGKAVIEDKPLKLLNKIIEQTNAVIILISSWKIAWRNKNLLGKYLDTKIAIYDDTQRFECARNYDRIAGIKAFLEKYPCESYVVLDDCVRDIPFFIRCNPLTEKQVQEAIKILNRI